MVPDCVSNGSQSSPVRGSSGEARETFAQQLHSTCGISSMAANVGHARSELSELDYSHGVSTSGLRIGRMERFRIGRMDRFEGAGLASHLELALAALLLFGAVIAGIAGLALLEPNDDSRWVCVAALVLAFIGAFGWLVAWVVRARTAAAMVVTAQRMATLVDGSDDLSPEAQEAVEEWVARVALAQVAVLLRADAYVAAEQVQRCWGQAVAALADSGEKDVHAT